MGKGDGKGDCKKQIPHTIREQRGRVPFLRQGRRDDSVEATAKAKAKTKAKTPPLQKAQGWDTRKTDSNGPASLGAEGGHG